MARVLRDDVYVSGRRHVRGSTESEVGAALSAIGDHAWEEVGSGAGEGASAPPPPAPEPVAVDVVEDETDEVDDGAETGGDEGRDAPKPPARSGPGSSEKAWRDYAKTVEADVSEADDRAGVIAILEALGKPV